MNILLLLMNVLRKRRLPVPFLLIEWVIHTISVLCSIFFLSHSCCLGLLSFARDASYHCQALCSLHPCSSCSMLSNLILCVLARNLFLYNLARDVCHCQILFLHSCSWPALHDACTRSYYYSHTLAQCLMFFVLMMLIINLILAFLFIICSPWCLYLILLLHSCLWRAHYDAYSCYTHVFA
jgi:hypothetical protein